MGSGSLDAAQIENVQYLEEKIQAIKKITLKNPEEKSLKLSILKNPNIFSKKSLQGVLTLYLGYLNTKFGMNRTSRLGVTLNTDRQIHRKTLCFINIRNSNNFLRLAKC